MNCKSKMIEKTLKIEKKIYFLVGIKIKLVFLMELKSLINESQILLVFPACSSSAQLLKTFTYVSCSLTSSWANYFFLFSGGEAAINQVGNNSTIREKLVLGTFFSYHITFFLSSDMLKYVLIQQIKKHIQSASYLKSSYVGLLLPEARKGRETQKEPSK